MSLELSQITALRRNCMTSAVVGPLAAQGVIFLQSNNPLVSITGERIAHIDASHQGISDVELLSMSYGLRHGLFIADSRKPDCLIVNYLEPGGIRRFKMAIKAVRHLNELWISTFHRLRPRQTKALLRRGVIIKKHDIF